MDRCAARRGYSLIVIKFFDAVEKAWYERTVLATRTTRGRVVSTIIVSTIAASFPRARRPRPQGRVVSTIVVCYFVVFVVFVVFVDLVVVLVVVLVVDFVVVLDWRREREAVGLLLATSSRQ